MKTQIIMAAMAAVITFASCNKENSFIADGGTGTIHVSIKEAAHSTKAVTAYTTSQDYEKAVKTLQLFVFDSNGDINIYKKLDNASSADISTTSGSKTVWAVVNGEDLSSVKTMTQLKSKAVMLEANSKTNGFVMTGSANCNVQSSGATSCTIEVSRLVARVALQEVRNSLPASLGSFTLEFFYLTNIVGNQSIDGTAAPATWYNKEGRADESNRVATHIIATDQAYKASCPDLTFKTYNRIVANGGSYKPTTPDLFYCYKNDSTTKPDGFKSTFSAQRTALVVVATINGKLQYYPVFLDKSTIERNTSYTVAVNITGLGSDDPNKEVEKGNLSVSIQVADWTAGATYDEII